MTCRSATVKVESGSDVTDHQRLFHVADDKKEASKSGASKDTQGDKSAEEKRRKADRRKVQDPRNWTSYSNYPTNSYGRHSEPKRRPNRGPSMKGPSSRRDSKYSESEFSDEISGSGREDRNSRGEREKMKYVSTLDCIMF